MTTPKRHRRRSSVKPGYLHLITAAASFVTAVALTHTSDIAWVLLAALSASVAYMLGSLRHKKPPARKAPTEFAKRKRATERQPGTRATGRGWTAPVNPDLLPMMISEECSDGACALCPGNGCEHDCMHDPFIIEARNKAEYDRANS